jgi:hypothetical protein
MFRKSNKSANRNSACRKLGFESLQDKILLSATPLQIGLDYNSEIFPVNFYGQELDANFQSNVLIPAILSTF